MNTKDDKKVRNWKGSSIKQHDLYNFESKIDYKMELTEKKKTSYILSAYLFIPSSLQINKDSYSKEQFFSDINNRIRFKTPKIPIEEILNEKNELSPITTILKALNDIELGKSNINTTIKIERESCLLADIIKVSLRDRFNFIQNKYIGLISKSKLSEMLNTYLESIKKLQLRLEMMGNKIVNSQIPLKVREAFQFADEYISLQIERWLTRFLEVFEDNIISNVKTNIIDVIEKEQRRREYLKSYLIILEENNNETFSYQEGIMKKFVQSVLYLEKKKKDPKSQSLEIFYSVAAGVAMFFSLFFGFLILSFFAMYSIPFIIATVVIYMLKDRIKDNIRTASQKAVGSIFPDRRIDIIDGFYKEKIGKCIEIVNFKSVDKILPEILKIRKASNISSIEESGKPEDVILYQKKITLFNKKINQLHTRKKDLSDVIRFNVRSFLRYADDPIQFVSKWNIEREEIEEIPVSKVYHLNLILKLTSYKGKKVNKIQYEKFRIIIDQKGIKRVVAPDFIL